jgi:chagasin family peptidase inhibitor I42
MKRGAVLLLVVQVALVGCSTGSRLDVPRDSLGRRAIVLDLADDSRSVGVSVGGSVAVQLPSEGPGGGSAWRVVGTLDESVLKLASSGYRPPTVAGQGLAVLTFQAVGPGSVTVRLSYGPPDDPESANREFMFVVSVT